MAAFNLSDIEFNEIRYDVYKDLRSKEPVYWYEPMKSWLVMRHDDITKLLRGNVLSTNFLIEDKLDSKKIKLDDNIIAIRDTIKKWMIYNDAPEHTRLRKYMNTAFKKVYIQNVMPNIETIIQSKLESSDIGNEFDFVENFAHPTPALILSKMFGLDEIDLDTFVSWSDSIANFMQDFVVSPIPSSTIAKETAKDLLAMKEAFQLAIQLRKEKPKNDLLSQLVKALGNDGSSIDSDDLMLQLIHLIFGGHKIPQFVMSNLLHCLLLQPNMLQAVLSNTSELLPSAIAESMRYESPIQFITRHAREDILLHGKRIKKGDSIYLMLGSANRDENVFHEPDVFNLNRPLNKHISFGSGIHTCIAAAFVKDELEAIFKSFFKGSSSIVVEYNLQSPSWTNNATFHGILRQPIRIVKFDGSQLQKEEPHYSKIG
ncbi:cytochrome P450 [Facilibium subflavum]|uniref:cytochrome P450 n=1 Tax=Facilibium subflavum TaxID=2219058 RepID=UPI000E64E438|nr:cytochrome P450 [Facilibium subflavum]